MIITIIYCTYCQCPVDEIDVDDAIEEPTYCNYAMKSFLEMIDKF